MKGAQNAGCLRRRPGTLHTQVAVHPCVGARARQVEIRMIDQRHQTALEQPICLVQRPAACARLRQRRVAGFAVQAIPARQPAKEAIAQRPRQHCGQPRQQHQFQQIAQFRAQTFQGA